MSHFKTAFRMLFFMSLLTGLIYPFAMTGVAQLFFPQKAAGSLQKKADQIVGSRLLAQNFQSPIYFWPRPSAVDYKPLPSGGSNLSQADERLAKRIEERREFLISQNGGGSEPPADLLFSSGSGLDPDISPEAATYQTSRIARARGFDPRAVQQLVSRLSQGRQYGILGEPRVNVLQLNLGLDAMVHRGQ